MASRDDATAVIERVATIAAQKWKRKVWWADVDDMKQEARAECVVAARDWDPNVGKSLEAYLWPAATRAIQKWCWRESSPVSGGMHNPRKYRTGKRTQALDDMPADEGAVGYAVLADQLTPEKLAAERAWLARVRAMVLDLVFDDTDMLGAYVVIGDHKPAHIAERLGVSVQTVFASAARLRRRIAGTLEARALLEERRMLGSCTEDTHDA